MRRGCRSVVSIVALALCLAVASSARADGSPGSSWLAGAAPEVSQALSGPEAKEARSALDGLAARGQVNGDHMAKLLGKAEFAPMARRTLVALNKVDGVDGVASVVKRLAKADSARRLIGPAFELEVAASFGADKVQGVGVYVGEHEVDVVLRDGTQVEAKHFPKNNPEVFEIMLAKSIEQLSLRSAKGKKPVMLVSNQPLGDKQLAAVRKGLGSGASVVVVDRNGARTTQLAGRLGQQQRQQLARKSSLARTRSQMAKSSPHLQPKSRRVANTRGLRPLRKSGASKPAMNRTLGKGSFVRASGKAGTRPGKPVRVRKVRGR